MKKYRIVDILFLLLTLLLMAIDLKVDLSLYFYLILVFLIAARIYGAFNMDLNLYVKAYIHGDANSNSIAFTFDDGPTPVNTDKVLKILRKNDISAAFFCTGKNVSCHPDLVREISNLGHIIGNHSFDHSWKFYFFSKRKMRIELANTDQEISEVIGFKPNLFRPPYGITNPNIGKVLDNCGYRTIGWSLRSFDTITKSSEKLMKRVSSRVRGGDIILFHDYSNSMIETLPDFIDFVKSKNLKIVRLDQLLDLEPYK